MSDELRTYDQTLVRISDNHSSAVRAPRYNPWALSLSVVAALLFSIAACWAGYQVGGQLGACLALGVSVPVPLLVSLYAFDGARVEHRRMVAERQLLETGPKFPPPPAVSTSGNPVEPVRLKLGLLENGKVAARTPNPSAAAVWLRNACLLLVRGGKVRGSYSRAALAEGPDALMSGEQWDAASPEVQRHGYFYVKLGKGGGLLPVAGKDLDQFIELLEVAQ